MKTAIQPSTLYVGDLTSAVEKAFSLVNSQPATLVLPGDVNFDGKKFHLNFTDFSTDW